MALNSSSRRTIGQDCVPTSSNFTASNLAGVHAVRSGRRSGRRRRPGRRPVRGSRMRSRSSRPAAARSVDRVSGMDQIGDALAIDRFGELADALRTARAGAETADHAMFTRATTLGFAAGDTPPPLVAAFAEVRDGVSAVAYGYGRDVTRSPRCSGQRRLITLAHGGRLRPERSE